MTSTPDRIDLHHHMIPPAFRRALAEKGISDFAGAAFPKWSAEDSLRIMDANGIATAFLSLSSPGVHLGGSASEAQDLARACNDFAAETADRHPGRFGFFATLPMPFVEDACREAIHALDVGKADGVVLFGSTDGQFLGDPRFDELMAELDRRDAIVLVHPNIHETSTKLGLVAPGFLVEFLCDTTRAVTNLILSGTVAKYPRIRWVLAHAGGFVPYIAWRMSLANLVPPLALKAPKGMLHYLRGFYYETALSPSPYVMGALRELVEPDHILFGSDYPFAPEVVVGMETRTLEGLATLDDATRRGIDRENAAKLFLRFFPPGQIGTPTLGHRVKAALTRPLGSVAERVRDR